jgi:hypothetical protein
VIAPFNFAVLSHVSTPCFEICSGKENIYASIFTLQLLGKMMGGMSLMTARTTVRTNVDTTSQRGLNG